jgi:hypothetical protein
VRLPSIRTAASDALRTLRRFPLVLLAGGTAAVAASLLVNHGTNERLIATVAAASLGLPLFVALAVTAERTGTRSASIALQALGLIPLVAFAVAWPQWSDAVQVRRYAQFSLGFHLLVAFLPYARGGEPNGFWHYNRTLFLRFLTAALYSAVLYLGLVVALVAIDQLLKIKVHASAYSRLWFAIAFVFNTWFFLGGMPANLSDLESRRDYPAGLKVFSQFILIPLVVVYLTILTLYLGRILITGQWPSGWIGYLVSGVAVVGILSLLLVHPIREREENRWVATYASWFYVALLPAIGMLLASIWKRIGQHGVTEDRYFIAVLGLWLMGIAATFIARRATDIRVIPTTLCLLAFATVFGPQGAYTVSRQSQMHRLRDLLARGGLIAGGVVRPAAAPVAQETQKELSAKLAYLLGTHGTRSVRALLGAAMPLLPSDTSTTRASHYGAAETEAGVVMKSLGLQYVAPWDDLQATYFSYAVAPPAATVTEVSGYHVHLPGPLPCEFSTDGTGWKLEVDRRARILRLASPGRAAFAFPLDSLVAAARATRGQPTSSPSPRLEAAAGAARAVLAPRSYTGRAEGDSVEVYSIEGDLYLTLRP